MTTINEQTTDYNLADLEPLLDNTQGNNTLLDSLPVWLSAQSRKSAGRGRSADNTLQYGVQKLRELILELAVRGKLVPQDPNDEPASVLLEKIAEEKARLVKEGKIKKQKKLPGISDEEKSFSLPSGWSWARLQDISSYIQRGKGPKYSDYGRVRVISQKCVQATGFDITPARFVDDTSLNNYQPERFLMSNDLLWNSTGTGTVGRVNVLESIKPNTLVADSHVTVIRPLSVSSRFICCFISAPGVQLRVAPDHENSLVSGSTKQVELNTSQVVYIAVPVPPLAEQHRIVKKVDELMALCDQLEQQQADAVQAHDTLVKVLLDTLTQSDNANDFQQNWRRIAKHFDTLFTTESSIDQLKQIVLQLAVMGKLVPQDPNDEPASMLITRVQEYLLQQTSSKHLPKLKRDKSVYEPEHYQHQVPSTWEWVELQDIFLFTNGKAHEQFVNEKGKFVLINSKFVSNSGRIRKHVSERLTPLETGDISIVMSDVPNGRALARCYLIEESDIYTLNQRIGGLKASPELDRDYLLLALDRHPYMLAYNDGQKQTNLKKVQIMSAPMPIPPLAEQHRIVKKVHELMALCDKLKDRLNQALTLQQQLADAVVERSVQ